MTLHRRRTVGGASCFLMAILLAAFSTGEAEAGRSKYLDYPADRGAELAAPPADKALVVFLRPAAGAKGIHSAVYQDEEFLLLMTGKTAYLRMVDPGEHRFMVVSEAADFLAADLDGGKIYFIQVKPRMGAWRARFSLHPILPETADWSKLQSWLNDVYLVEPNDAAGTWAEKNHASAMKKKSAYLPKWEKKADSEKPMLRKDDGVAEF